MYTLWVVALGQTDFTERELLLSSPVVEPLFAGGVRCHGGFDEHGRYVTPRTRFRAPAIDAWQEKHRRDFGTEILDVPLATWPAHFPSVGQARYLIGSGIPEPLIASLTRIGTVEGLGANIRQLRPCDLQRYFVEDIDGTATVHLGRGLFEAHGRDEAGWEEEAGHREMWFAARDIAFGGRTADVDIEKMLARMGLGAASAGSTGTSDRLLPDDIDPTLETIVRLMARILLIEISAFHTFAWAEDWLSDPQLVAGDGAGAELVTYIRADETPHIGYLRTSLTEMRDRTWVGTSRRRYDGREMIATIWDASLQQSLGPGREQTSRSIMGEVEFWCRQRRNGDAIVEGFHALDESGSIGLESGDLGASPLTY